MKIQHDIKILVLVLIGSTGYYLLFLNFQEIKNALDTLTNQGLVSYMLTYVLIGIPIFIATRFVNDTSWIGSQLGISNGITSGFGLGMLFTLPMFLGGLIFFDFSPSSNAQTVFARSMVAGFMEELYFRGFLFGLIFRYTRFGFIPSIFFGAIIFALGHLYQSTDPIALLGIFGITFAGAIFFAWLYVEWKFNLWVPIFTHALMNLSWHLFSFDTTALGSWLPNILRGLTIFLAIYLTLKLKRHKGEELEINRRTIFPNFQS